MTPARCRHCANRLFTPQEQLRLEAALALRQSAALTLHNRKTLRAALIARNIHAFAQTICAQNAEIVTNGAPTVRDIHQFFGDTMNAALPAQALKETAAWDNPMGLMGFEFVEFTSPQPGVLEAVFEKLGFTLVAKHRSKDVRAVPPERHQLHPEPRAPQPGRVLRRRAWPLAPAAWPSA